MRPITLDETDQKLQVVLAGAITTTQPDFTSIYFDKTTTSGVFTPAIDHGTLNSTTDVDAVAAPAAGHTREVTELIVHNRDTVAATLIVKLDDGGVERILWRESIAVNASWTLSGAGAAAAAAGSGFTAATQTEQEAASSTSVGVTPGRQQYHPSAAKAWVEWNAETPAVRASYNVTSLTDNGAGDTTVNFTTAFSSGDYAFALSHGVESTAGDARGRIHLADHVTAPTTSAFRIQVSDAAGSSLQDFVRVSAVFFGDQ
jgi:hypothetical protein